MQIEVTNLKTKHIMYAWFNDLESYKMNLKFYSTYKERGSKKYSVKIIKCEN